MIEWRGQRVMITGYGDKIVRAVLQRSVYIDGVWQGWQDVRVLPVSPDGKVQYLHHSLDGGVVEKIERIEVPQAFQEAFGEGELEL